MKRSSERILTTHAGALPQPADLKQMHAAQTSGQHVDQDAFAKRVRDVVAEVVKKQLDCGLDIINDGEVGKSNFSRYARDRLSGSSNGGETGGSSLDDIRPRHGGVWRLLQQANRRQPRRQHQESFLQRAAEICRSTRFAARD